MRPLFPRVFLWIALLALPGLGAALPVAAQIDRVGLSVEPGFVGLSGYVRPGGWVPLRVSIDNPTADDLDLLCRWVVTDEDGDLVAAQRRVAVNAQRTEHAWLYAPVPYGTSPSQTWTVRLVDAPTGRAIASLDVRPAQDRWVRASAGMIAVTSNADLGLNDYARHNTQHERLYLARGAAMADLPDRWYGMASLSAIIWTDDTGGDPAGPDTPSAVFAAVREWVLRGGHLVIVMPTVGQSWTQSPLADLLPFAPDGVRRVQGPIPAKLGVRPAEVKAVPMYVFDTAGHPDSTVLLRNSRDQAVVVAARRGFGTVTVIGLDLTHSVYRDAQLPNGKHRLWNDIFRWTPPVYTTRQVDTLVGKDLERTPRMRPARDLPGRELAQFIPGRIAMQGTVATVLLGAIALLLLYVAAAGVSFVFARRRGVLHHAWLAFVSVVAVFSVAAWGGAWLAKPTTLSATHLSVMDIDGNAGVAHTRSWLSLFVPRFGSAEVAVASPTVPAMNLRVHNTLSSPGVSATNLETGFLDPQTYTLDADEPDRVDVPLRATTKRFFVDAVSPDSIRARPATGDGEAWLGPASFEVVEPFAHNLVAGQLTGKLRHHLPGPLRDVLIVYCPGEGTQHETLRPLVWRYGTEKPGGSPKPWNPGETLELAGQPASASFLFTGVAPVPGTKRNWKAQGWLGALMEAQGGVVTGGLGVSTDVIVREMEMLSFFDALPAPDFTSDSLRAPAALRRSVGRSLDLSAMLNGPRLIILGHLEDAPLPADFTVDGKRPDSAGWLTVRYIYDLAE